MKWRSVCVNGVGLIKHRMSRKTKTLLSVLKAIQKIDKSFPLQYAQCLVIIAMNEGLMPSELAKEAGIPAPTVSRIVHALAKNRQKGKAYSLVEIVPSKESLREKKLYLTPKGKKAPGCSADAGHPGLYMCGVDLLNFKVCV